MSTATAVNEAEKLRQDLEAANARIDQYEAFLSSVQSFSDIMGGARSRLKTLVEKEAILKEEISELRGEIKQVRNQIESSSHGMLALIEPGPDEFLPLFDQMEQADPDQHGEQSETFRGKPISALRLSPLASAALVDAEILWIGQLQDMILADPDEWWKVLSVTDAVAAAVADKLADFVSKGGQL